MSDAIPVIPRYIQTKYAFDWLDTLQEKWAKKLIADFVTPFRTQGIVTPFGTAGIMVTPPFCRQVPMITVWDVVCLLWTHYLMKMGFEDGMNYQDKMSYLGRMQVSLIDKIEMMEVVRKLIDALWFLGDYFKGVERVAKGLATDRVPWILRPDVGTIEEIKNAPLEHYTFPVEKKRKKKKSSRKKHH
ncbi:unnamed protein product [Rhizophagus irregularis]|nr:unnamed protein product [Rhizophagus irregularis]